MNAPSPSYVALLRQPGVAAMLATGIITRLASGVVPFGAVAIFTAQHRIALAGIAFAAFLIVTALSGPWRGRLADRKGPRVVLPVLAVVFAALVTSAALASRSRLPLLAVVTLTAAAALAPPTGPVLRTVWTRISISAEQNRALHALDSVLEEATYVVTPLMVSALWVYASPAWALVLGGLSTIIGTVLLLLIAQARGGDVWNVFSPGATPDPTESRRPARRRRSIIWSRNGLAILAPMIGLGTAMGVSSVAMPTWAGQHYHPALSGILFSAISAAGVVGGLIFGKLKPRLSAWAQYATLTILVAAGAAILAASATLAAGFAGAALLGLGMTPMFVIAYVLVGAGIPPERLTEANASIGSAYNIGSGTASAITGILITATSAAATLLTAAVAILALGCCALLGQNRDDSEDAAGIGKTPEQHIQDHTDIDQRVDTVAENSP